MWVCTHCGERNEGVSSKCWVCSRPASSPAVAEPSPGVVSTLFHVVGFLIILAGGLLALLGFTCGAATLAGNVAMGGLWIFPLALIVLGFILVLAGLGLRKI